MLIGLEILGGLIAYWIATFSKKISLAVATLVAIAAGLFIAGMLLVDIWGPLVLFPVLVALGGAIGLVIGVAVRLIWSRTARDNVKRLAWFCGLIVMVLLCFHSQYRSVYDRLATCAADVEQPASVLAVFEGLEEQHFRLVLEPRFGSVSVIRDNDSTFLFGGSEHDTYLDGSEVRAIACELTLSFSRPVRLDRYTFAIRIDNNTNRLLSAEAPYDSPSYTYTKLVLRPQPYITNKGAELVAPNGQRFTAEFKERQTKGWKFSHDYFGLHLTFALEGEPDTPPLEKAIRLVNILKDQQVVVPVTGDN